MDTCEISIKSCSFKWCPRESKCPTYSMYFYVHAYNTANETVQITLHLFTMLTILQHLCHLPKGFLKYFPIPNSLDMAYIYKLLCFEAIFFLVGGMVYSLPFYSLRFLHFTVIYPKCIHNPTFTT